MPTATAPNHPHPSASPHPVTEDGIENGSHEHLRQQESTERDALADRTHDDIAGRFHEDDFEQREHVGARIVSRTGQEKALTSDKTPQPSSDKEAVQTGHAPQIPRGGVDGRRSKLKCITNGPIGDECETRTPQSSTS